MVLFNSRAKRGDEHVLRAMFGRLLVVIFLLGGFAVAFAEVAKNTSDFTPASPCGDGSNRCMTVAKP